MRFRVRRLGEELGNFSLDELRQRRDAGEFSGNEYVQREGASDWQPLDAVLHEGYRTTPPPLPSSTSREPNQTLIWSIIVIGVLVFVGLAAFSGYWMVRTQQRIARFNPQTSRNESSSAQGLQAARKPIVFNKNTLTVADAQKRGKEFRIRQWLDGYEKRGQRNPECDAEIIQFFQTWIARNYGGDAATNSMSLESESAKLAANTNCTDPLVLTVLAANSLNEYDATRLLERALNDFPDSLHKAYPKFYSTVILERHIYNQQRRVAAMDVSALQQLRKCFGDASFTPDDQQEIADVFINGWGNNFFNRNRNAVCQIANQAGKNFEWLALALNGEKEIIDAWAARGGGFANTVSAEGWKNFATHLASARKDLTRAWKSHPDFPLAPERMIYVSLGDSDIDEMRAWFDRTTSAQIDYPRAWSDFRWGLRPRWYGSEAALLAFGKMAVDTKRFDTDVPRKFFDCVSDVESELNLRPGEHIYGRDDIWPTLQKMYEGYITATNDFHDGWLASYATVAFFAGKYNVARTQLEALNWKPSPNNLSGWGKDLSLMPLEIAARTSSMSNEIAAAESSYQNGNVMGALMQFGNLTAINTDSRTKEFIRDRLASLDLEQHLQKDEWINFLPTGTNDSNWIFQRGKIQLLPDGALEVHAGPDGHFLFSRVRVGPNFEVKGQFELVHSSTESFQAGLVMGAPDVNAYEWYSFRIRRHPDEVRNDVSFARTWNRPDLLHRAALNDVTNTFDFRFQNGKISATVNGQTIFQNATPPTTINVSDNEFLLGLGAFNSSNETDIRYRNIQVRRLD